MPVGALDANGIWQYDTSDPLSPGPAFMNLGQASVSTQVGLLKSSTADTGWTTPTLGASWVAFDAVNYASASYRRKAGLVILSGLIKSGTTGSAVFTLPAGYRPLKILTFVVASATASAVVSILANGNVQIAGYGTGGSNANVSLSGITFVAEA